MNDATRRYKVILCGDSSVGKTTLLDKLVQNYKGIPDPTTACTFQSLITNYNNSEIHINFWDTAGQERFRSLIKIYFRGANVVLYVCDITSQASFESINYWIQEAENNNGGEKPRGLLVVNKIDLVDNIQISEDDLNSIASQYNIDIIKVSGLHEAHLAELKDTIVKMCVNSSQGTENDSPNKNIQLEAPDTELRSKFCC